MTNREIIEQFLDKITKYCYYTESDVLVVNVKDLENTLDKMYSEK